MMRHLLAWAELVRARYQAIIVGAIAGGLLLGLWTTRAAGIRPVITTIDNVGEAALEASHGYNH